QRESWAAALVRHGSLREHRQVSPFPETFATTAKPPTSVSRKFREPFAPTSLVRLNHSIRRPSKRVVSSIIGKCPLRSNLWGSMRICRSNTNDTCLANAHGFRVSMHHQRNGQTHAEQVNNQLHPAHRGLE